MAALASVAGQPTTAAVRQTPQKAVPPASAPSRISGAPSVRHRSRCGSKTGAVGYPESPTGHIIRRLNPGHTNHTPYPRQGRRWDYPVIS